VCDTIAHLCVSPSHEVSFMSFATGAAWVLVDKVIKTFGALLVGILVTRYLGPADNGILNFGLLTLGVCMTFIPNGMKLYAIKELGAGTPEATRNFHLTTAQLLVLTALGYLAGLLMLWFFAPKGGLLAGTLVLSSALSYPLQAMKYQMESKGDFKRLVIIDNSGYLVASLARILVIWLDGGVVWMAASYILDVAVVAALLWWVLVRGRRFDLYRHAFAALGSKELFRHFVVTLPLLLTAFISYLYLRIDQLIVAIYLEADALGLYSAAMRINDMSALFPIIMTTALYPMLARQFAQTDKAIFFKSYRGMLSALIYVALAYIAIVTTFSEQIAVLLFGHRFAPAGEPVAWLAVTALTTYLGYMWHAWMVLEGKGNLMLKSSIACMVLSCSGSLWLVPRYGIVGAAMSTSMAYLISAIYTFCLYSPRAFAGHVVHAFLHPLVNIKHLYQMARQPHVWRDDQAV